MTDLRVASEVGGDIYGRQCQRRIARRRCRMSERNIRECQKKAAVSAAPRIGVLGRDPEPDDEARFRRPIKERAECAEKRARTKERYEALRSFGSRGIRSHG